MTELRTALLTPDEAAKRCGYASTRCFLRYAKRERLPRVRFNARVIRFDPAALANFTQRKTV